MPPRIHFVALLNFIFIFLVFNVKMLSQKSEPDVAIELIKEKIDSKPAAISDSTYKYGQSSIFYPFFIFYKVFLSRHDIPDICRFHPSCANYAMLSLRKYGIGKGVLRAADRLQRCNNFHYKNQYVFLPSHNKYIDEP